jgi:hypothetical protein
MFKILKNAGSNSEKRLKQSHFSFILQNSRKFLSQDHQTAAPPQTPTPTPNTANDVEHGQNSSKHKPVNNKFRIDLSIYKKLICLIQKLFEIYHNNNSGSVRPIEIVKTNLSIGREHELLLAEAGKIDQLAISESYSATYSNNTYSNVSTPVSNSSNSAGDVDRLANISSVNNELLLNKLEFYREFLDKKTLNKLTSDLFYNSTASILMPKSDMAMLENYSASSSNCIGDLDLVDQYFNLNAIILIPFKFLIQNKWLDTNLKNLIVVSLCELVECSSYKIKSSWNCIFNCLNKIDLNENCRFLKHSEAEADESFCERINSLDRKRTNPAEGYMSSSAESLASNTISSSSSVSSLSSGDDDDDDDEEDDDAAKDTTMDKASKLSFTNAAFKFDSKRARLSSLVDIFHIFLSLAEDSDYVLANGAFNFLKCISCYLQYKNTDIDCLISSSSSSSSVFMSTKREKKKKTKEDSVNDFEEDEDLYVSTNDNLVQEKHYQQITNFDRLIELSDANDSNSPIRPFLICIEKLFHILIKGTVFFSSKILRLATSVRTAFGRVRLIVSD